MAAENNFSARGHYAIDDVFVANGGEGPTEVGARYGRDVAAGVGVLGAGAGAAGPLHPKQAPAFGLGFSIAMGSAGLS